MSQPTPRTISTVTLGIAAGAALAGLAALSWTNADSLLERSFAEAFSANGPRVSARHVSAAGDLIVSTDRTRDELMLTHLPAKTSHVPARVGERLTLVPEGGQSAEFEVVAVTDISGALAPAAATPSGSRLAMITYREVPAPDAKGSGRAPRIVRMIVDTDEAIAAPVHDVPARTL